MPISDQSIIAPAQVDARPPIKKKTIGWLVGIGLGLAVLGAVAPLFMGAPAAPQQQVPTVTAGPAGDPGQIDREVGALKAEARRSAASSPTPVTGMPTLPGGPLPPGMAATSRVGQGPTVPASGGTLPVIPDRARRDDNTGALYSRQLDGGPGTLEQEAAARQAASVKFDASGGEQKAAAQQQDPVAQLLAATAASAPNRTPAADTSVQSRALAAAVEANRPAAPTTGAGVDRTWLRELGGAEGQRPAPLRSYRVTNPYTLLQGKVIPAVLTRELNSDLPGTVSACTTVPIYDSLTGEHLLIPQGSCLIGQYSNAIALGQERLLFAFTRILLPDGTGVDLPAFPGSDLAGRGGATGDVDNHFVKMFTTSLLVAFLADRAEQGKTIVQSGTGQPSQGPVTAAGQVLVDVSRSILDRNKTVPPTISVPRGTRINIEVARDIQFPSAYAQRNLR